MPEEPQPEVPLERSEVVPQPKEEPISRPEAAPAPERSVEKEARIEGKYLEILKKSPGAQSAPTDAAQIATDARSIGALTDEDAKVNRLLELAESKGVAQAVKVAYALRDYYVLDRMHDELADRLYDGLVSKGLLKKEE